MLTDKYCLSLYDDLQARYPEQKEYLNACKEVLSSLQKALKAEPKLISQGVIARFIQPDRIISFKVSWVDDKGNIQVNHGYRVQFNNAIGPYKGGLRFHPTVNESILKFLGLEQCLKNSLTGLPMGGGKGGADFDPKGKSDGEVMRFCQAFMTQLYPYIGPDEDVPAGDIGVGGREIGYLYGQYKKITRLNESVLTGKGISFGGSLARKEATGYGLCYFAQAALKDLRHTTFQDKKVIVSGSGNVAIYAAKKAEELGATVLGMSDSNGYVYNPDGIDIEAVRTLKEKERGRLKDLPRGANTVYEEGPAGLYGVKCDIALPCATQGEVGLEEAKKLVANGVIGLFEGANMPTSLEAIDYLMENKVVFGPGKAANAGGVAVSGLEMSQNAMHLSWPFQEVDAKLKAIMETIYLEASQTGLKYGDKEDLLDGANLTGFEKIADAMLFQGI